MTAAPTLPLFELMSRALPAARRGQVTQQGAARAVAGRAPGMRERVFSYIRARSSDGQFGAINEEIAAELRMKIQTVCGRVNELQQQGRVAWTPGEFRDTSAGVKAKVWRVVDGAGAM